MKKEILLLAALICAGTQAYAANGDLIVDGKVGIGTTAPVTKFQIVGTSDLRTPGTDGDSVLRLTNTYSTAFGSGPEIQFGLSGGTPGSSVLSLIKGTYTAWTATPYFGGDLSFYTRTAVDGTLNERLRVTSTGNVGIGTMSPVAKLDVVGNIRFGLRVNGGPQPGYLANTWTAAEAYKFATLGSSYFNGTNWITNEGTGFGSNNVSMLGTDSQGIKFFTQASSGNTQRTDTTATFNTYERMRINTSGNVGIGTTTPTSKLHVVGLPAYANNAAATAGGLTAGAFYRTGGDPDVVCVVH